jgi:hypothetical protein
MNRCEVYAGRRYDTSKRGSGVAMLSEEPFGGIKDSFLGFSHVFGTVE